MTGVDFSGVLQTVLAITTVIGVALAGLQRGVVTNLREALADIRARFADKVAALVDMTTDRDKWKTLADQRAADLEALGRVVSNEVQIAAFGERLEQHHEEAKDYWTASTEQGQQIIDALNRLSGGTRE